MFRTPVKNLLHTIDLQQLLTFLSQVSLETELASAYPSARALCIAAAFSMDLLGLFLFSLFFFYSFCGEGGFLGGGHFVRVPGVKGAYRNPSGNSRRLWHLDMSRIRKPLPFGDPGTFVVVDYQETAKIARPSSDCFTHRLMGSCLGRPPPPHPCGLCRPVWPHKPADGFSICGSRKDRV